MLNHPARSDYEIAKAMEIDRSMVYRFRHKLIGAIDYYMARDVAHHFLIEFQMALDYFKLQIERLEQKKTDIEELKQREKTIFKKGSDGKAWPEQVPLEVFDILAIEKTIIDIEKHQTDLWSKIVFMCNQSKGVEILKLIKDGRIKPLRN